MKLPGPDHPITITTNPKRVRVTADGVVIAETTQAADDHLLSEIEFELHKPIFNLLTVRSRALMLLANIITRIPGRDLPSLPAREAPYVQTIRKVEQRLRRHRRNVRGVCSVKSENPFSRFRAPGSLDRSNRSDSSSARTAGSRGLGFPR